MCGIVGLFCKSPELEPRLGEHLAAMLVQMNDRGPDSAGVAVYRDPAPAGLDEADALLGRRGRRLGRARRRARPRRSAAPSDVEVPRAATRSSSSRPTPTRPRRGCARQHPELRVMSAGQRDRDLQGGRPARARSSTRFALADFHGHARARPHAHGDREPRHDRGLAPVLDRARPLPRAQRLAVEPQRPAPRAAPRGHRVPDRERHRGRRRLPDLAAARGRVARGRRSRAASRTSTASTRSLVGTADGFAVLRDPIACKPAVLAETDDWVAMASEYRAIAVLPGAADARIWEPEPARRLRRGRGRRRVTRGRRRGRGRRSRRRRRCASSTSGCTTSPATTRARGAGGSSTRTARTRSRAASTRTLEVEIDGHVGYYCAGMNKRATVRVHGNAGTGLAENMMSGTVVVDGNASQSAGATGRGGLLVVHGDAARALRHLDEGRRHRRARLGRPPERVHGADAAASSSAATRATRSATRSTRRGSTCAARSRGSAPTASRRSCATSTSRSCASCSSAAGIDDVDPAEFRRYGSARQLYNFNDRQRRGVLMGAGMARPACASRTSSTAT